MNQGMIIIFHVSIYVVVIMFQTLRACIYPTTKFFPGRSSFEVCLAQEYKFEGWNGFGRTELILVFRFCIWNLCFWSQLVERDRPVDSGMISHWKGLQTTNSMLRMSKHLLHNVSQLDLTLYLAKAHRFVTMNEKSPVKVLGNCT